LKEAIIPVLRSDRFSFKCTDKVPCFNNCCQDLNQYLTPYDILRLKNHFGLSSGEFLEKYTRSHTGTETGLPIITLKTNPSTGFQCPFVESTGCRVYENRPTSCRLYPLARTLSRSRETGEIIERYFLVQESHCQGFLTESEQTVDEWLGKQGVNPYNEMNDLMMHIIQLKNALRPGPLDSKSASLFHLACYDIDSLKTEILENRFSEEDIPNMIMKDDYQLLKFGIALIGKRLFSR
jgi:uncharacterized protein